MAEAARAGVAVWLRSPRPLAAWRGARARPSARRTPRALGWWGGCGPCARAAPWPSRTGDPICWRRRGRGRRWPARLRWRGTRSRGLSCSRGGGCPTCRCTGSACGGSRGSSRSSPVNNESMHAMQPSAQKGSSKQTPSSSIRTRCTCMHACESETNAMLHTLPPPKEFLVTASNNESRITLFTSRAVPGSSELS